MEVLSPVRALRDRGLESVTIVSTLVLSVALVLLCWSTVTTWIRAWKMLRKLPGHPDLIPMAYALGIHNAVSKNADRVDYKTGATQALLGIMHANVSAGRRVTKIYIGLSPIIVVYTAEGAETLLKSTTLLEKSHLYEMLNYWLGTGLLTSDSSKWRGRRKLLTPAFHFKLLDDFLPLMAEHASVFVKRLQDMGNRGPVDVMPLVSSLTLDVICETAMGISIGAQKDESSPYVKAIKVATGSVLDRLFMPWLWYDALFFAGKTGRNVKEKMQYLHHVAEEMIRVRKQRRGGSSEASAPADTEPASKRPAFLDILLSLHFRDDSFTEEGIREEMDTFMFAGHDTTAMGISFTLYLLGLYKNVQEEVCRELDEIFGDDTERPATLEDIKQMKYLECAIKESHRLYPPIPIVARRTTEDVELDGNQIPRGTTVAVFFYNLHRDARWFPKPEEYRPERFLPENSVGRHPYAFIPFSAGPRNCIGQRFALQEEKIVISSILRNFRLHSPDPRDAIKIVWQIVLRSQDGLRVEFIPRKRSASTVK